jgi:putative nucleotidyltransferase with HDIG domain
METIMNNELEKTIMAAGDLPAMPVVATKVMQLVEDENVTAVELARIVASDPAVAARIMKISNSPLYGCQSQNQTLPGAIMLMGFNTLKSLVVVAYLKDVFKPVGLMEKMLWEHSFGAGLAARLIASDIREVNPEEAFLAGLLHDIGKLIMHNHDQNKFQRVIERYYNEGMWFVDAEKSVYPYTHAELGGCVLKKWNFPDVLVNAVTQHHTFAYSDTEERYQQNMTAVASLANLFCIKLGIGERTPQTELDLTEVPAIRQLKLDNDRLERLMECFAESYERDKSYFS